MKKRYLLLAACLSLALLTVGCGNKNAADAEAQKNETVVENEAVTET